jgi:GTPase involved in cell partitioning and DNA repair
MIIHFEGKNGGDETMTWAINEGLDGIQGDDGGDGGEQGEEGSPAQMQCNTLMEKLLTHLG